MKNTLILIIIFQCYYCFSQNKHDSYWIIGQGAEVNLNFNIEPVDISLKSVPNQFGFASSNISMCDSNGELLFYSNGCEVRDRLDNIMINGDSINPGILEQFYCSTGGFNSPISQGLLSLPMPGQPDKYYLFNQDLDIVSFPGISSTADPKRLYFSIVDMGLNGGLGEVVSKNNVIVEDSLALARGQLTAVRHANGIDWWVITPQALSNCYYLLLLTSQGITENKLICNGEEWNSSHGIGQATFSPDGTKYARFNPWNGLHIFDFDRCKGELSNGFSISFPEDTFGAAGLSISPNSRFLYAAARTKLYQFDLQATDVANSRMLIDTLNLVNVPSFSAVFYLSQLAPDNKIYIAGISSHRFLHVINEPDSLGAACDFRQQAIEIPALNFASIPNFPNFDLGALQEPCEPIVSTTEVMEKRELRQFQIYPNPSKDFISIKDESGILKGEVFDFVVYNITGKKVFVNKGVRDKDQIFITNLPSGSYFFQIIHNGKRIDEGKFIKIGN